MHAPSQNPTARSYRDPTPSHSSSSCAPQEILAASRQPLRLDRPAFEQGNWWEGALPTPGSEAGPCGLWSHLEHPDVRVGGGSRRLGWWPGTLAGR